MFIFGHYVTFQVIIKCKTFRIHQNKKIKLFLLALLLFLKQKNGDVFRSEPSQHFCESVFLVRISGLEPSPKNGEVFRMSPSLSVDRVRIFAWTKSAFWCGSVNNATSPKLCWSYYPHRSRELVSPVCGIFLKEYHTYNKQKKAMISIYKH